MPVSGAAGVLNRSFRDGSNQVTRKKLHAIVRIPGQACQPTHVYHVNGDLTDSELRNLKTVCLNCAALITRQDLPWRRGDLEPDL